MSSKYTGYPYHTLKISIIYTKIYIYLHITFYSSYILDFHHLHKNIYLSTHYVLFIIHISTRTCHTHHKRGVTEVCYLGHFWLSYGRCAMSGSPIGLLVVLLRRQTDQATPRKILPSCMFLGVSWLIYNAWNNYRTSSRAILMKPDYVTCGTMCHV